MKEGWSKRQQISIEHEIRDWPDWMKRQSQFGDRYDMVCKLCLKDTNSECGRILSITQWGNKKADIKICRSCVDLIKSL